MAWGISPGPTFIAVKTMTDIGTAAIDLTHVGDDRLFMAVQGVSSTNSRVFLWKNNTVLATPFLDFSTAGIPIQSGGEKGLLGIAFHPNFLAPAGTPGRGKFYTYTSEAKNLAVTPEFSHPELGASGGDHDGVIREWTVSAADADVVDYSAAARREVFRFREPQANHNGGAMKFGPDGYLYLAMGDGGSGNDFEGSVGSTTDGHSNPNGNAQTRTDTVDDVTTTNIYGKILRFDPLKPTDNPGSSDPISANGKYRVPSLNPFQTNGAVNEIYAYGLRNPFRMSFDRLTGSLYAGDVGQNALEEVDVVTSGGNYGWVFKEGTGNGTSGRSVPMNFSSIAPVAEYGRSDGTAVIGGYVYRGLAIPELYGKYVFGDLALSNVGRLFYMDAAGGAISEFSYYFGKPTPRLYSFGEDRYGELYAMFADGTVRKILGRQWNATGSGSWGTSGNWIGGTVPSGTGSNANFLGEITGPATVTLDGSRSVGAVLFNSFHPYTIAAGTSGTLSVNRLTSAPTITVQRGSHTIASPLDVTGGAVLTVGAGAALTISGALTGKFGIPAIDPAGKLDLRANDMIVDYGPAVPSPLEMIRDRLTTGYNGGNWNGLGITTSVPTPGVGQPPTGLGYAEASRLLGISGSETALFGTTAVDATSLIIKYTYYGDVNFDGVVNADDYVRVDLAFAAGVAAGSADWMDGDFDFDRQLTSNDYFLMDWAFGAQTGALSPEFLADREGRFGADYVARLTAAVPEPATGLMACGAWLVGTGRRRHRAINP